MNTSIRAVGSNYSTARQMAASGAICRKLGLPFRDLTSSTLTLPQRVSVGVRAATLYMPAISASSVFRSAIDKASGSFLASPRLAATVAALAVSANASASAVGEFAEAHPNWIVFGGAVGVLGCIGTIVAGGFAVHLADKNMSLGSEIQRANRDKDAALQRLAQSDAQSKALSAIRNVYLEALLSMSGENRQAFLKLVTAQVLESETPANLAKLLAPFPQDTADMILRVREASEKKEIPARLSEAFCSMDEKPQLDIAAHIYRKCGGDESVIEGLMRYYAGSSRRGQGQSSIDVFMGKIAAAVIIPETEAAILANAAKSKHPSVRAVVISHPSTGKEVLISSLADAHQPIADAAAVRLFVQGVDEPSLVAGEKSKWPSVRIKVVQAMPLDQSTRSLALLNDQDANVRAAMFARISPSLDTAKLRILLPQVKFQDIRWAIAKHSNVSADTITAMLKTMRKTLHVIDQEEQGHNEGDSYNYDWVVDQTEESHDEFEPADLKQATEALSKKTFTEIASIVGGIDTELAGILRAGCLEPRRAGILASLKAADPASLKKDLLEQTALLIGIMTVQEVAAMLTEIGAQMAGKIFNLIPGDRAPLIVRAIDAKFIADMFKSLGQ
ncbi:MAG: hypothetical protein WC527_05210 [Candidatus Margulisiibacteriota bacterium]